MEWFAAIRLSKTKYHNRQMKIAVKLEDICKKMSLWFVLSFSVRTSLLPPFDATKHYSFQSWHLKSV